MDTLMKLETIALHHGYDSDKMTKNQQTPQSIKPQGSPLTIRSMAQTCLTLRSKEIFIQE